MSFTGACRYGGVLIFTLTVPPAAIKVAAAFAKRLSPSAKLTYNVGGRQT